MVNRSGNIGTAAETAVVRYLAAHGFPHAERRRLTGAYDRGDITGTPGIVWEVKGGQAARGASDRMVASWLAETERERMQDNAQIGVLVIARAGVGAPNAGRWWAVLDLWALVDVAANRQTCTDLRLPVGHPSRRAPVRLTLSCAVDVVRAAGYGDPHDSVQEAS